MTQEYEFFKDFAGVTKADLEMFKCGGGMKKKKMEKGAAITKKAPLRKRSNTYAPAQDEGVPDTVYVGGRNKKNYVTKEIITPTGRSHVEVTTDGKKRKGTDADWNNAMKKVDKKKK